MPYRKISAGLLRALKRWYLDSNGLDELVALYDGLTREQAKAVLEFAAQSLVNPSFSR